MTGGASGWSAPPTVFKEKSLLEIEEEKRRNQSKKNKGPAPKAFDQRLVQQIQSTSTVPNVVERCRIDHD